MLCPAGRAREGLGQLIEHRSLDLSGSPACLGEVRARVRELLNGHAESERIEDIVLITDELLGNAFQHGGGAVSLDIEVLDRGVIVAVTDRGADLEAVPTAVPVTAPMASSAEGDADLAEGGRGMLLISVLADTWTVAPAQGGKIVSAVLTLRGGRL